jgi:glyoxalase family protein
MRGVNGLHHVTAISGPAQENLDFYAGVLGMRLVKRSVNQDDPGTYHLFYADAEGHAGTDLTFFPWAHLAPSRDGHGLATEVSLAVPADTLDWWGARLSRYANGANGATVTAIETRFGERVLPIVDPHGLRIALVETAPAVGRGFTPWDASPVPPERQIRGLHGARVVERDPAPTAALLTGVLGFVPHATEGEWRRFVIPDPVVGADARSSGGLLSGVSGRHVDVCARPDARRGAWGTGSVHHLAWRVDDDAHEAEVRGAVESAGAQPTPVIDRFWFKSVYFKEPGGVLFELATDGPGFAVDEAAHALGESLVLPPWLEKQRAQIQAILPALTYPPALSPVPEQD